MFPSFLKDIFHGCRCLLKVSLSEHLKNSVHFILASVVSDEDSSELFPPISKVPFFSCCFEDF